MSVLYADTSALVRAYFEDESDHQLLRTMLLEGDEQVVTSEVARVEMVGAVMAAFRARRLTSPARLLARIDSDCGAGGPIALIRLRPSAVLSAAYRLVSDWTLRTLDAIHLAVAVEEAPHFVAAAEVAFVTRDADQAAAASGLGLTIR